MLRKRKALSLLLIVCFLVTLFPFQALAYVNTDNIGTAAVKNAKGNWVGGDTFTCGAFPEAFRLIGYWDVLHSQTKDKLGKAPVLNLDKEAAAGLGMAPGCYTMVNPNTLEAWVETFNGNLDFVKSVVEWEPHFLKRDSDGQTFTRYWLRDIAYASGASIDPDEKREQIIASISEYPAALFEHGIEEKTFTTGEPSTIGIYGELWVLYRQKGGYPGLTWELLVDGEKIASDNIEAMATKKFHPVPYTFCCPGEYTLTLIVTDGVGRQTKNEVTITVEGEEIPEEEYNDPVPQGDPHLKLTVVNQLKTETRPENTAKWTDWITADFTAPSPPDLGRCYRLKTWELQKAEIVYPKKHKDFTFGHPLPPEGTVTKSMEVDSENNTATIEDIQEDWSMNGAFVYDILTKKMIPGPTLYPITVNYEILWEYEKGTWDPCCSTNSKGQCRGCCKDWEDYEKTVTGSATVQLLVNGTGVDSRAQ